MLNQSYDRRIGPTTEWCVGEPPARWDVSFGARLADQLKRLFRRQTDRVMRVELPKPQPVALRKAA